MKTVAIPRIEAPSKEVFDSEYRLPGRPVVLTGLVQQWPSWGQWSLDWFESRYGHLTLSGNNSIPGKRNAQVGEYIRQLRLGDTEGLYLDAMPVTWLPGMSEAIQRPVYCPKDRDLQILVWLGPGGTCLNFHKDNHTPIDGNQNLLAQLLGRKRVVLVSPEEDHRMYPHPQAPNDYLRSQVLLDSLDLEQHPLFADATLHETEVQAGEVIYIPAHWWHYVRSLETSMSVTFWWRASRLIELMRRFGTAAAKGQAQAYLDEHQGAVTPADVEELGGNETFLGYWEGLPERVREVCQRMLAPGVRPLLRR